MASAGCRRHPDNYLLFPDGPFIGDIADTIVNFTTETNDRGCAAMRSSRESRSRGVESQTVEVWRGRCALALDSSTPRLSTAPARGVTLIELLIVILIISILAGLVLGVAAVAGETAREAHTRHIVARLHTLLMEHYDTYKTRRVQLRQPKSSMASTTATNIAAPRKASCLAEARLYALREMMLMEIPDRWSDVLLNDVPMPIQPARRPLSVLPGLPLYFERPHGAGERLSAAISGHGRPHEYAHGRPQHGERHPSNQGAECLYMVITMAMRRRRSADAVRREQHRRHRRRRRARVPRRLGPSDQFPPLGAGIRFADSARMRTRSRARSTDVERRLDERRPTAITIRSICSASTRPRFAWCR